MVQKIKQAIMDLLKKNPDYSFSEIISELEELGFNAKGDQTFYKNENLIIWDYITSNFETAIRDLENERLIELKILHPTEALLVYAYGREIPNLPISSKNQKYAKPHWLPMTIKINK